MTLIQQLIKRISDLINGKQTVDSILGTFHKAVASLEEVAKQHAEDIKAHEKAIEDALAAKVHAVEQIASANTALTNIRALIGK